MNVLQKLNDARRGYDWRFDDIRLVGIQRWTARLTVTLAADSPAGAIQLRTRELRGHAAQRPIAVPLLRRRALPGTGSDAC